MKQNDLVFIIKKTIFNLIDIHKNIIKHDILNLIIII